MAQIGRRLLPWQAEEVRWAHATRPDGKFAAYEVCTLVARQNGKGGVCEGTILPRLFLMRQRRIVYSATLFSTAQETFNKLVELLEGSDWLRARTAKVLRSHGHEGIELTAKAGGGKLLFLARTDHSGRGLSGETVLMDEAYGLKVSHVKAITPVLATLANPQILCLSSPPDDKTGPMPEDAMLPSIRARGQAGDPRMSYAEWSPGPGDRIDDVNTWYATNPALGDEAAMEQGLALIAEEYLHDEYRLLSAAPGGATAFGTEHCGAWPVSVDEKWTVVTEAQWLGAQDVTSTAVDPVVFAIAVNRDRTHACIGLAGFRPDGDLHVEVPPGDHRSGTSWVVDRAVELNRRWKPAAWIVDLAGPAGSLGPDLATKGITVTPMTGQGVAAAYGMLYDGLTRRDGELVVPEEGEPYPARRVWHHDDPRLATVMAAASTRRAGKGVTWAEPDGGDITAVQSVTAALWGLLTLPPPEPAPEAYSVSVPAPADFFRPTSRLSI